MAGDMEGKLGDDGRLAQVTSEVEELWKDGGGLNKKFWENYLVEVLGEDRNKINDDSEGENYRIRDRGGSAVTIEKKNADGEWVV
jgi:hypothetical protein